MSKAQFTAWLAEQLRNAQQAHYAHEQELGHPDADWSAWYAEFVTGKLEQMVFEQDPLIRLAMRAGIQC